MPPASGRPRNGRAKELPTLRGKVTQYTPFHADSMLLGYNPHPHWIRSPSFPIRGHIGLLFYLQEPHKSCFQKVALNPFGPFGLWCLWCLSVLWFMGLTLTDINGWMELVGIRLIYPVSLLCYPFFLFFPDRPRKKSSRPRLFGLMLPAFLYFLL